MAEPGSMTYTCFLCTNTARVYGRPPECVLCDRCNREADEMESRMHESVSQREPEDAINAFLHLDLCVTVRGNEAKGWCSDIEDGGRMKFYLDRKDCQELSVLFAQLAAKLKPHEEAR